MNFSRYTALIPIAFLLTACDPEHLDTANQCAAGSANIVRATFDDFSFDIADLPTGEDAKPYKPYFTDILKAMQLADGVTFTDDPVTVDDPTPLTAADKQALVDSIIAIVGEQLGYTITDGEITTVDNPLEFVEYLVASEDPDEQIGLFQIAKSQIEEGINSDDGFCRFRNDNIVFNTIDETKSIFVDPIQFFYNPFTGVYDYGITTLFEDDTTDETQAYSSGAAMEGTIFTKEGFTEPDIARQIATSENFETSLEIQERYTDKLFTSNFPDERENIGILLVNKSDTACDADAERDTRGNVIDATLVCDAGIPTKTIEKAVCAGVDGDPDDDIDPVDLTNKIKTTSFDLGTHPKLQGIKRISVETDYETEETRIYVSKYVITVLDSDGETEVADPTVCEQEAILDEIRDQFLAAIEDETKIDEVGQPDYLINNFLYNVEQGSNNPENLATLITVADPGYDTDVIGEYDENGFRLFDEDGNALGTTIEPVPILTFQGAAIPERKPPAE